MKHVARMVVVVVCAAVVILGASRARAQDPEADFDGFRIPDHRWRTLNADASGSFYPSRASNGTGDMRREDLNARLGSRFATERDSDLLQHALSAQVSFDARRSLDREAGTESFSEFQRDGRLNTTGELWRLSAELRRYAAGTPLAVSVSVAASGIYQQRWYRTSSWAYQPGDSSWTDERRKETSRRRQHDESVSVTLGMGHVRDATGIYNACVLERRLEEAGVLQRPLSAEGRQRLAGLFYARPAYQTVHDRSDRFFWRDVERVLREDGAIEGGLDAWAVMRINEATGPVAGVLRKTGIFAGPIVRGRFRQWGQTTALLYDDHAFRGGVAYAFVNGSDLDLSQSDEDVALGGRVEYHAPLGTRWQVDGEHETLAPVLHVRKGLTTATSAQLSYLVADRWLAQIAARHSRNYALRDPGHGYDSDTWNTTWSAGVDYYLEDRTKIRFMVRDDQSNFRSYGIAAYQGGKAVLLGVSYTFLNQLVVPDFGGPGTSPD